MHKIEEGQTAFAYVFEGEGLFAPGSGLIGSPHLIVFGDGDAVEITTRNKPVRFLLVSGKPLGEPIARYGPFVMNTQDEIRQALEDLRNGTFVWQKKETPLKKNVRHKKLPDARLSTDSTQSDFRIQSLFNHV